MEREVGSHSHHGCYVGQCECSVGGFGFTSIVVLPFVGVDYVKVRRLWAPWFEKDMFC